MIILTKVHLTRHVLQLLETLLVTIFFATKDSMRVGSADCLGIVLIQMELEVRYFDSRH